MRAANPKESGVNLTQSAYEQLRADILSCRLLPGSKLKIQELCTRYAVSLGAIREALSRLTSEGLVTAEPQRGFKAAPISPEDLTDLTKVRIEIDSLCLRKAIENGDVDWESRLVAAFHRMSRTPERAAGDPTRSSEDWAEAHAAFHTALVEGCGSPWLMRLHGQLYDQSERYRRLSVSVAPKKRNIGDEHQKIMDAVLARDADKAVKLLAQHLGATTAILLDADLEELPQRKRAAAPARRAAR
ncbi:MAG TPA: FCD domain-containing protein [Dongiaceae bacterium]|jgi:DNA-binding GntR family transcriptional regulator|nr:FCD domain-containing protein [Dongiaceae bacterium]